MSTFVETGWLSEEMETELANEVFGVVVGDESKALLLGHKILFN